MTELYRSTRFDGLVGYFSTNENLEAITLSLKPTSTDKILAVGGSGDQAFAMLETGAKIMCVDNNAIQVEYIAERAKQLKNGNYEEFLATSGLIERDEYFQDIERIRKIKENLKNLELSCADVFKTAKKGGFTKIYLSNTIGHNCISRCRAKLRSIVSTCISKRLPQNGLIYVTDHGYICGKVRDLLDEPIITEGGVITIPNPRKLLPKDLIIDRELTTIARRHEDAELWQPAVYRKTI